MEKHTNHHSGCPDECHVGMLKDPDRWPLWPRLPLKRRFPDGSFETAVAVDYAPDKVALFPSGNVFSVLELGTERYLTPEEIVAEGWVVD